MAGRFREHIERAREAATADIAEGPKDPASMTDEERAKEIARLEEEVRRAEIREIYAAREELEQRPQRRTRSPFAGRNRKPFK
jgi:hypothetical protein